MIYRMIFCVIFVLRIQLFHSHEGIYVVRGLGILDRLRAGHPRSTASKPTAHSFSRSTSNSDPLHRHSHLTRYPTQAKPRYLAVSVSRHTVRYSERMADSCSPQVKVHLDRRYPDVAQQTTGSDRGWHTGSPARVECHWSCHQSPSFRDRQDTGCRVFADPKIPEIPSRRVQQVVERHQTISWADSVVGSDSQRKVRPFGLESRSADRAFDCRDCTPILAACLSWVYSCHTFGPDRRIHSEHIH